MVQQLLPGNLGAIILCKKKNKGNKFELKICHKKKDIKCFPPMGMWINLLGFLVWTKTLKWFINKVYTDKFEWKTDILRWMENDVKFLDILCVWFCNFVCYFYTFVKFIQAKFVNAYEKYLSDMCWTYYDL